MPSPGELTDPGIEPGSPALQVDSVPAGLPGEPLFSLFGFNLHIVFYVLKIEPEDISLSKRGWFIFGQASDYMKQPSEMVSAIIQAIGTSIVAPIAIMVSPNKSKVHTKEEEEAAKEKRVFQALLHGDVSVGMTQMF